MKKMTFLAVILALALALSACGSDQDCFLSVF